MRSDLNFENLKLPSISIVKTIPKVSEDELFSHERCYMGISLDNPGFKGKSLQALLLWVLGNFEQCLVVVGDYLCRFNEQIFNHPDCDEAVGAARRRGDSFMRKAVEFFEQIPTRRLAVTRWEPCLQSEEYKKAKVILDELFASDSAFRCEAAGKTQSKADRCDRRGDRAFMPISFGGDNGFCRTVGSGVGGGTLSRPGAGGACRYCKGPICTRTGGSDQEN
ncbi:MAG: tRNA-dependent cyclodipeptide synthase [Planctomycetota bacterium]